MGQLLLLWDLPHGALTGGWRSCSGGKKDQTILVHHSDDHQAPGQWFPGQGMSPAPLLSPPPEKFSVRKLEKALP